MIIVYYDSCSGYDINNCGDNINSSDNYDNTINDS